MPSISFHKQLTASCQTEHLQEMERLALLVPEAAHLLTRKPQEYALAYIERYQNDILQLEQEWNFLTQVLGEAWQNENYEIVVRLVVALAHPAGRRAQLAEGEQVLRLGVAASRRVQDRRHMAAFLNRLGGLRFARGKYQPGWRLWQTGYHLALSSGASSILWQPLLSFAQCADMLGYPAEVQSFVETVQSASDPDSLAVALFVRGLYARFTGDLEMAWTDLSDSLHLVIPQTSSIPCPPQRQLFRVVVQAELARAQGDYTRSQAYTETALALAEVFSDRYTVADLLIDQGLFTYQQGQFADMYAAYQRLNRLIGQLETPHIAERSGFLAHQLTLNGYLSSDARSLPAPSPALTNNLQALSERECEVLTLVASGLPNREIARQLVITPGTVKKHLEHIYTRLDVHSRTAAVAQARTLKIIS